MRIVQFLAAHWVVVFSKKQGLIMESSSFTAFSGSFKKITAALVLLTLAALPGLAQPNNTILLETWTGITGSAVSNLTSNASYPNSPATRTYPTLYEQPATSATDLGTRTRAFITPPTTGVYNFYIACDDACELWLSTTDNASGRALIASTTQYTNSREWTKYASQKSANITLTGGERYYIETLHKQASGGGNLAVGWQGPGITGDAERPIPGSRLMPFQLIAAPTITTQPAPRTVTVGATAAFTVVASGTGLSYQWKRGGSNVTTGTGGTTPSYTTAATVAGDNGAAFTVKVSNAAGSILSNSATLTVTGSGTAPTITTHPANQTVNPGATATFTVVATGTPTLTFQWKKGGNNVTTGTGGTTASYTTAAAVAADHGSQYTCVVSNGVSPAATSNAATLNVNTAPVITSQPSNTTVTEYVPATFTVGYTGFPVPTFEWFEDDVLISGAPSSATLTVTNTAPDQNGVKYSVKLTNGSGAPVTSAKATLTVNFSAKYSLQPGNASVSEGKTAQFCIAYTANPAATIQWHKLPVGGTKAPISGATGLCYTTPALTLADNGAKYSTMVGNTMGSVSSNDAVLSVTQGIFVTDTLRAIKVVADTVVANVLVTTPRWRIPDYVFEPGYKVRSLEETEAYIKEHRHLPEIPGAAEIEKKGMSLGDMNLQLLKTVEELTLNVISLKKDLDAQKRETADMLKSWVKTRSAESK
jgi:hypothetical protein